MKPRQIKKQRTRRAVCSPRFLGVLCLLMLASISLLVKASPPSWWTTQGVTDATKQANDFAAVNQGQVKNLATAAAAELDADLPSGGAGDAIHQLVASWNTPTAATNDYAAVNLGQLKNIAKPFYDRLIAIQYTTGYPWTGQTVNDYAMANIGQVKNLFSFDLMSTDLAHDTDQNGLPDWWEKYYFGHIGVNPSALAPNGAGLTNLQAFQQGQNPIDYYNGQTPTLAIVSGNNQTGNPNGLVPQPLVVQVSASNGQPIPGGPVNFAVSQGGGQLQASSSATPGPSITALADGNGQAKAFFKLPNVTNSTSQITATAGTGAHAGLVTFSESSDDGSGTYNSPFAPSSVVANMNPDGSTDVTWTNNADPSDQTPIAVTYRDINGNWVTAATVPAGTTSVQIPAQ